MIATRFLLGSVLVLAIGCSSKHDADPAAKGSAQPKPAATATPPPVALAAGESLAKADESPNGRAKVQLAWTAGGSQITLAAIERGGKVVVRAFTAGGAFDVTEPIDAGTSGHDLIAAKDGAVVFALRSLVGRAPEAGALFSYEYRLLRWDAASGKPIVADKWSCDDTKAKDGCNGPAWTAPDAPAAGAVAPPATAKPDCKKACSLAASCKLAEFPMSDKDCQGDCDAVMHGETRSALESLAFYACATTATDCAGVKACL